MGKLRLLADLDDKLVKDFKKALIDDDTNLKNGSSGRYSNI